jgi:glycosyltransferase involved in cell wall biosynthesis
MRIAVLHRYPPHQVVGTNASFLDLLRELTRREHKVYYISYRDEQKDSKVSAIEHLELPFKFDRGNSRDKTIKTYIWIILVPFFVAFWSWVYRFDLIYCDDSVPFYAFLIKILARSQKVVMRLGDLQSGYTLADDHPRFFRLALAIETLMWKTVDGVIAISQPFRRFIVARGVNPNAVSVVEESIDLQSEGSRRPVNKKGSPVTFLFHGSFVRCKGMETLIDAFTKVQHRYQDVRLILAGGGSEEKRIRNQVERNKVKNVTYTGWYDHKLLPKIMKKANVGIVMRSQNMANNFVVTTCLLENWKFRKPVIVPSLDAFLTVIKDGYNGRLFHAGNPDDLAHQMVWLLQNRQQWAIFGENGYRTAKKYFNARKIAGKMAISLERYVT